MTFEECARCGHGTESGAVVCEQCGARLGGGPWAGAPSYAPPAVSYAPGEAPAGVLPLDFPARPLDSVGDVLGPTFSLYRKHLPTVAKIVLAAAPAQAALDYLSTPVGWWGPAPFGLAWLASTAVGALVTGALVHALMTLLRTGASPPLRESFAWGLRKWWKLMVCFLLVSVSVGMGTLMLCVPGLFLMVVFAVAMPAAAAENLGPVEALTRSVQLTAGYRWLVFVTMFVASLLMLAAFFLIGVTSEPPPGAGAQLLMSLVYAAVVQLLYSLNTVVSLFIYLSLRTSRGEVDAPATGPLP